MYLEYVAAGDVEVHVERVAARADAGGHAAPPDRLRQIYAASIANLIRAMRQFERVDVYGNGARQELLLEVERGRILYALPAPPAWLRAALRGTEYDRRDSDPEVWRGVKATTSTAEDRRRAEDAARRPRDGMGERGPARSQGPER